MFCRSFEGVCTRLGNALESLRGLVVLNCGPTKDTLIQHSFTAIQIVQSVKQPKFFSLLDSYMTIPYSCLLKSSDLALQDLMMLILQVFYSMNDNIKEQNKDAFLRFLIFHVLILSYCEVDWHHCLVISFLAFLVTGCFFL